MANFIKYWDMLERKSKIHCTLRHIIIVLFMEDRIRNGGINYARKNTIERRNGCFNWAIVV